MQTYILLCTLNKCAFVSDSVAKMKNKFRPLEQTAILRVNQSKEKHASEELNRQTLH